MNQTWQAAIAGIALVSVLSACGDEAVPNVRPGDAPGGSRSQDPARESGKKQSDAKPSDATTSATPSGGTEPDSGPLAGTDGWRVERPAEGRISGFATRASGLPGTAVDLKVSTSADTYRVTAYRIGAYEGGVGRVVWRSHFLEGKEQADPVFRPAETRTVVAPWKRSLRVDTTGWQPGFYLFELRTGQGFENVVPYVVSSPSAEGTVALVAPATTWQAYNRWGGYSLYHGPDGDQRSYAVSFDRPYDQSQGANDYRSAAMPIVVRAEQLGIPLSYYTNVDLHTTPGLLDGAHGYVSMGHDEYWTTTMRSVVTEARDAGTNLAFLGANTMYWRVRLEDRPTGEARVLVGYRHDAHLDPMRDRTPREATFRFRDAPAADPEDSLIGMQYECYPVDADYVVVTPEWWGFRDADVGAGDRIPDLVGPEADRVYPSRRLPRPMQILSRTPYDCAGVPTVAESVYYTTASGAGVFTAGTLRWGCALVNRCEKDLSPVTRTFVHRVTGTLLEEFARGPVGRRHPAKDNIAEMAPSPIHAVSAS